jgi:hypothetical protein
VLFDGGVSASDGGTSVSAHPAICSNCSCAPPNDLACVTTANVYDSPTCTTAACATATLGTACTQIKSPTQCNQQAESLYVTVTAMAAGSACTANPEMVTKPTPTWAMPVLVCGASGMVSCNNGTCAPDPGMPAAFELCLYQSGNVPCPTTGPYTTQTVIYGSYSDTRDCSMCTCGTPTADCTLTTATISSAKDCGTGAPTTNLTCLNPIIPATSAYYGELGQTSTMGVPMCAPTGGGQSIGGVSPTEQMTLCCM